MSGPAERPLPRAEPCGDGGAGGPAVGGGIGPGVDGGGSGGGATTREGVAGAVHPSWTAGVSVLGRLGEQQAERVGQDVDHGVDLLDRPGR